MYSKNAEQWRTPDGLTLLEGWSRDGLDMKSIAAKCGCTESALARWRRKYPEIDRALSRTRTLVDYEVEQALLRRAVGYCYRETVEEGSGKSKTTTKEQQPDISAIQFWLKNRQPQKWTDKPQTEDGESLKKLDAMIRAIDADAVRNGSSKAQEER